MSAVGLTGRVVRFTLPRVFSLRGIATIALLAVIVGGGWMWFRTSSFVRVRQVTITGLAGPAVPQIERSLRRTATTMSTLHMNVQKLDAAVSRFPEVRTLTVSTHFPHGLSIHVYEQVPVATVSLGGQTKIVDGAGDVLAQSTMHHGTLPTVPLKAAAEEGSVSAHGARAALAVLAAAPYSFLTSVETATSSKQHGVIVTLREGPQIYFGDPGQLVKKWKAALDVITSTDSHGASYIDVSDPLRPAAGAGAISATPSTDTGSTGTL